jgi:CheY-like chemotaxis protein
LAPPRILVVDDEQPLARVLAFAFQNEGYRVEIASDGIDCMNKIVTFGPDVVLMDVMMPKLDGIETIRVLKRHRLHRNIVVVVVSAKALGNVQDEARSAGADLFVKKPFQIVRLVETVAELLATAKSPRR